jgi:cation:H+ antiporter
LNRKYLLLVFLATLASVPGMAVRLAGISLAPSLAALVSGTAIIGASFLLLWACDAAQSELPQSLALAVVALIAVLPEYAVDMYFTWQAGQNPASDYAHYAIANMTGANRLLIGVAWSAIVGLCWLRFRRGVRIENERRTELFFLALATAYACIIPIKGSLAWYDGVVFLGIYVWYIVLSGKRPCAGCEADGPAELITRLPKAQRRMVNAVMFLFAAGAILTNAQPFCEGLIQSGKALGINEFLLVQWLAPIASEAPEFIVALMFAWRGQAGLALGSLLAAKLNQWTLLVGMIPGVFAVSHGTLQHPLPMSHFQMSELLLTAAQSLLGIALLVGLRLSLGGAALLFGLFAGQLILPTLIQSVPALAFGFRPEQIHPVFTALYFTVAISLILQRPRQLLRLRKGLEIETAPVCPEPDVTVLLDHAGEPYKTPHCARCKWRGLAETEARV